jgi:phosphoglycerate kinase
MTFHKKTVRDVPVDDMTVLVRADFDVPLNDDGKVIDDLWIKSSITTIEYLLNRGCKVVVAAHYGKPIDRDKKYSLEPAAARLAQLLGQDIRFVDEVVGDKVSQAIKRAPNRSVIVLENLRFHPGEEDNDYQFAKQLAESTGARYLIQDGFNAAHHCHASTSAITAFLPSVAGMSLEYDYLTILRALAITRAKNQINLPGVEILLDAGR